VDALTETVTLRRKRLRRIRIVVLGIIVGVVLWYFYSTYIRVYLDSVDEWMQ